MRRERSCSSCGSSSVRVAQMPNMWTPDVLNVETRCRLILPRKKIKKDGDRRAIFSNIQLKKTQTYNRTKT